MKFFVAISIWCAIGVGPLALFAQELPESIVTEEHKWLKKFVGTWEVESEGTPGEGLPPISGTAVMKSSMLGDIWLVNKSDHEIAGMKMKSIQMIGYDTNKKKHVGTWADSMVNHMWQYEGTVDDAGKKITLEAKGPSMSNDGSMTDYRDEFEFQDDHTIIATSSMKGPDGKWMVIMKGMAKRRQMEK